VFEVQTQRFPADIFQVHNGTNNLVLWMDYTSGLYTQGHIHCGDLFGGPEQGAVWAARFVSIATPALFSAYSATATLQGGMADGASAVAVAINAYAPLSITGSKILSIRNQSVEKTYVDSDGYLRWPGAASLQSDSSVMSFVANWGFGGNYFSFSNQGVPKLLIGNQGTAVVSDLYVETPAGNVGDYTAGGTVHCQTVRGGSYAGYLRLIGSNYPVYIGQNNGSEVAWLALFENDGAGTVVAGVTGTGSIRAPRFLSYDPSASTLIATNMNEGANAVAVTLDTLNDAQPWGAGKLLSIRTHGVEQAYVSKEGSYILTTGLWDDVPCRVAQAGGSSALTQEAFRDTAFFAYFMRHDQDDVLHLEWQMPHSWDPTTSVKPHIHLVPMVNPASPQNIRFTGKYVWAQVGVAIPADASWTAFTVDHTVGTTDEFKQFVVGLATVAPPSNPQESNLLMMWLMRPGSSDAADTYTTSKAGAGTNAANVMVASVDAHFQKVKAGTVPEIP
jgi:hypothetical protein